MTVSDSTFAQLRRRERERRIKALSQRLKDTLGPCECSIWLFGSLARGDWDGFSDTDLLVVAANQDEAERAADQLGEALAGDSRPGDPPPSGAMSQARPGAWWRQARADSSWKRGLEPSP